MRFFKTGSFEGIPRHRMQGTKVTLAGRTAFLPNRSTPLVIQDSEADVAADCATKIPLRLWWRGKYQKNMRKIFSK